jgi:hypothetical protein
MISFIILDIYIYILFYNKKYLSSRSSVGRATVVVTVEEEAEIAEAIEADKEEWEIFI